MEEASTQPNDTSTQPNDVEETSAQRNDVEDVDMNDSDGEDIESDIKSNEDNGDTEDSLTPPLPSFSDLTLLLILTLPNHHPSTVIGNTSEDFDIHSLDEGSSLDNNRIREMTASSRSLHPPHSGEKGKT